MKTVLAQYVRYVDMARVQSGYTLFQEYAAADSAAVELCQHFFGYVQSGVEIQSCGIIEDGVIAVGRANVFHHRVERILYLLLHVGELGGKTEQYAGRVHLTERSGKLGLGTAYITGFRWALERGYEYIFEMDADFSHNPADLPLKKLRTFMLTTP